MLSELQRRLMDKVQKQTLPARLLLSRFYFPDEELRRKSEYLDNSWSFWYYLGSEERPRRVLDVGSKLGLEAACCVLGARRSVLASVHAKRTRFTAVNLKLAGAGVEFDCGGDWDLALVGGDFLDRLDFIWGKMRLGGLILTNDNEVLENFAKVKNRVPVFCKLRGVVGLLRK